MTPSLSAGGFTIDYAEQTTVLSLPSLRRLRFPALPSEKCTADGNLAARAYLAALGLVGATLALDAGYDLRSRCLLHAPNQITWDLLGRPGDDNKAFQLPRSAALELYKAALTALKKAKLPIEVKEIVLTPSPDLVALVKKSMELAATESGGE